MADELRRMEGYAASDISDNIAEVRDARGNADTLDNRLTAMTDDIADVTNEVHTALGTYSTLAERLAAIEARLDALENPT